LNDIKNGKSIVTTSKKYNIPTSALGEKMKKNNIKSAFIFTTKKYTEKDMLEALNDIKNGQSILESSKKYNIPNSTLRDRLKKPVEDSESHETTNQNAIEGLDEGDPEISFNLSQELRKIHSSVRIDRRLADRVMYLTNNGIQVQYNQVDDFKVQGSAPRSELQKKKKSKVSVQKDEKDLELGRQKLLDKFYSSNKKTKKPTSEPPQKKKSKVSVQEDEENLERCRQKLLDKLKSPSKLKKTKKLKRCDTKKLKVKIKKRHSMPN